jgi:hypothetical protein
MKNTDNAYITIDDEMIFQSSLSMIDAKNGTAKEFTSDFRTLKSIISTEKLILKLIDNTDVLFSITERTVKRGMHLSMIKEGRTFVRLLLSCVMDIPVQHQSHQYSPLFKLFVRKVGKHHLQYLIRLDFEDNYCNLQQTCMQLNACIADIRATGCKASFKHSMKSHSKATLKNHRGALKLVDYVRAKRSKVLVIRIDCSYAKKYSWKSGHDFEVTLEEFFQHRDELIKNLRKIVPENTYLDYILKTEFKLSKSLHHHVIVFLDGHKASQGVLIAKMIGDYWERKITQGRGLYRNINAEWDDNHPHCGIGQVCASDTLRIENLKERVVGYLTKPDFHIKWAVPGRRRAFMSSQIKKSKGTKRGAPRGKRQQIIEAIPFSLAEASTIGR